MRFEWDEKKNRRNLAKHRVGFDIAARVFDDPYALTIPDLHEDEQRWLTTGLVKGVPLLVVHTWGEEDYEQIVRIISVRKATPSEVRAYERERGKTTG